MSTVRPRPAVVTVVVLAAFVAIERLPFVLYAIPAWAAWARAAREPAMLTWKLLQPVLCVAAVMALHRASPRRAAAELGLAAPWRPGLAFGALVTLPMLVALVLTSPLNPNATGWSLLRTAVGSGLGEEVLFRGFLFLQLYRHARWPFAAAVVASALPFAYGHLYQARETGLALLQGTLEVWVVSALSAAVLAWALVRWRGNLWPLVGVHALGNLWWMLLGEGSQRMYGWLGNGVRLSNAVLGVALTLWLDRRGTLARWGRGPLDTADAAREQQAARRPEPTPAAARGAMDRGGRGAAR
jgi:hypothetical protein